ncbi:uncharacterized protein OCT59_012548 [Rhizophagus irregularis]|uniref:uncharacterized protein n=1 Tax=Rhizophagus irregularis TaxID=588596 RepID=UPI0033297EA3|nr:hypothetical protein OCT59_012548 [Rhizophagus irregularis]
MDEIKLSDDVIEQIKDFNYQHLTEKQKSLIDKLITDKELKERYKENGLCKSCKQPNTGFIYSQLKAENIHNVIEWVEYDKFEDVEYLAKGGFGTTFKAVWNDGPWKSNYFNCKLERKGETRVALKCLHNSQDITADFLKEVGSSISVFYIHGTIRCLGITKDPKTNNFIMVMDLERCSLRQHLNNNFISMNWAGKLHSLRLIAIILKDIHKRGLIHKNFHCGNILIDYDEIYITDLGLCQPANVKSSQNTQNSNKKIYGVLPYVAPEVLREKKYTQKSDIYGFGIIAYEICTGFPPYYDIAHDDLLAMKICNGLRPKSNYKIPQFIFDIINQCWDADPLKRPNAEELQELIEESYNNRNNTVFYKQIEDADEINKKPSSTAQSPLSSTSTLSYISHPEAVYTKHSESIKVDFTKLNINSEDCN